MKKVKFNYHQIRWKKYILLFVAILCALQSQTVLAQQRSLSSVKKIAESFLGSKVLLSSDDGTSSEVILNSSTVLNDAKFANSEAFYVIKPNSGVGFVIVSGDKRMQKVLGYSYTEKFDEKEIPSQVKSWLSQYADEMLSMEPVSSGNDVDDNDTEETVENKSNVLMSTLPIQSAGVDPLLGSITWNQSAPYNNMCPIDTDGDRSVTGCVATAMAQVMKYHQYPTSGTGSVSYTTSSNKLSVSATLGATYDWANMLDNYSGSYTTTQADAVALLMFHCGATLNMDYTSSSSGAYQNDIRDALYTYFGYDSDMAYVTKSSFTDEGWHTLLLNELNAGRPVNYSGSSGLSGHSFVFDGYSINDGVDVPYYHVNWGWNGLCNGNYLVTSLAPSTTGIGGGYGDYSQNQAAVVGVRPEDNVQSAPVLTGTFTPSATIFHYGNTNTFDISASCTNRTCRSFTGTLKLVAKSTSGTETTLYTKSITSALATDNGSSFSASSVSVPSSMGVGSYSLEWRASYTGSSDYSVLHTPTDYTFILYDEAPQLVAEVDSCSESITPTDNYVIRLKVTNSGNMEYTGNIIANIHQSSYDTSMTSDAVSISAGSTEYVTLSGLFRTMCPGSATVSFINGLDSTYVKKQSGENLTMETTAEVATADISLSKMGVVASSTSTKHFTIYAYSFENNSSVNFIGSAQLALLDTNNNVVTQFGSLWSNDGDGLAQNHYYIFPRSFTEKLPSTVSNGTYRLGLAVQQKNSGIWTLAKNYSSSVRYLDVTVTSDSVKIDTLTFARDAAGAYNVVTSNSASASYSFSSTGTYEWEWDETNSRLRSSNYNVASSTSQTTMSITTTMATAFSFDYAVSSESNYDKLTVTLDGTTIVNAISGTSSGTYQSNLATGSHTLVFKYVKDSSQNTNDDRAYLSNVKFELIPVTNITLSSASETLHVGETVTLTATVTPAEASVQSVKWSSSDTSVATVSSTGVVTAVGVGSAIITCSATDTSGTSAMCSISVTNPDISGDVNSDSEVDVSDLSVTVEYILGHSPSNFNKTAADLDNDNTVDVADLSMIANVIMYGSPTGASSAKGLARLEESKTGVMPSMNAMKIADNQLCLWLDQPENIISGLQFDVCLSGTSRMDNLNTENISSHSLASSAVEDGSMRVICYSISNELISPEGRFNIEIDKAATGVTVKNIVASMPNGQKVNIPDVQIALSNSATSIQSVQSDADADIYTASGIKLQNVQHGMNIIRTSDGRFKKIFKK